MTEQRATLDPGYPVMGIDADNHLYALRPNGDPAPIDSFKVCGFVFTRHSLFDTRPGDLITVEQHPEGWAVTRVRWRWWRFWRPAERTVICRGWLVDA